MNAVQVLLFLSVIPSIILGIFIYKMDKIDKEPWDLLLGLFFAGVGTIIPAALLEYLFSFFRSSTEPVFVFINCVFFIGLIEEGVKWTVLKLISWNNKEFNHIYDAIVYAVFVSLGFATLENILYVLENGFATAILRAIVSVPGHAFFGVFMGYYYGAAKQAKINNNNALFKKNIILSLAAPTLIHGIFDFCLFVNSIIAILFYFIFVIWLYIMAFKKVFQFSKIKTGFSINQSVNNLVSYQQSVNQTVSVNPSVSVPPINAPAVNHYNYCPNCGKAASGNFCTNCGNKLN